MPEVWGSTGRSEEKLKFGAEKVTCHRKNAGNWIQNGRMGKKIDGRTGKSGKNGDFGAKKVGWGSGEKMGFTADFAM